MNENLKIVTARTANDMKSHGEREKVDSGESCKNAQLNNSSLGNENNTPQC